MSFQGRVGVIGGLGPSAGLDLVRKLFDLTEATLDQDHLPVMLHSFPHEIAPRPAFLLGQSDINPGYAIGQIMIGLAQSGATVLAMPCNTAHSPAILDVALEMLAKEAPQARFIHMIDSVVEMLVARTQGLRRIGIMSTTATLKTRLYQDRLEAAGLIPICPDASSSVHIQSAISNDDFGIKAFSNPVTDKAKELLHTEARRLITEGGAEAILLGCTEIPLGFTEDTLDGVPVFDATKMLAERVIREFAPASLKKA